MSRTPTRCCFSSISRPRTSSAPVLAHRPPSTIVEARRRLSTDEPGSGPTQGRPRRRWAPVAAGAGLLTAGFGYFTMREDAPTLGGDRWTTVKIKSVTPVSPETSLFRLEVPKSVLPPAFSSDPTARPILSLYVKEPSLQIQRAYTVSSFSPRLPSFNPSLTSPDRSRRQPLSATSFDSNGPAELDLVVKRYHDGELSRYIHRLGPGSELHVRGPSVTWWYRPQDWDEVVFVSDSQCTFEFFSRTFSSPGTPAGRRRHWDHARLPIRKRHAPRGGRPIRFLSNSPPRRLGRLRFPVSLARPAQERTRCAQSARLESRRGALPRRSTGSGHLEGAGSDRHGSRLDRSVKARIDDWTEAAGQAQSRRGLRSRRVSRFPHFLEGGHRS